MGVAAEAEAAGLSSSEELRTTFRGPHPDRARLETGNEAECDDEMMRVVR